MLAAKLRPRLSGQSDLAATGDEAQPFKYKYKYKYKYKHKYK